jgi:hypothetical protein
MNRATSSKGCPQEIDVLTAARTGQWDDALETHAAACPVCREVALVSRTLRTLDQETEGHKPLPDPYLVWLKAKLTERHVASQRASKRWDVAQALGQGVAAITLAGWLLVAWTPINQRLVEWMSGPWLDDWSQAWLLITLAVGVPPFWVFWTLFGVMCFIVLMVTEPLFAER